MQTTHLLTPQRPIDGGSGIHVFYRKPHFGESYWTRLDGPDLLAHALVLGSTEDEVRQRTKSIVCAVNNHEALVEALELIVNVVGHNSCTDGRTPNGFVVALEHGRKALKGIAH